MRNVRWSKRREIFLENSYRKRETKIKVYDFRLNEFDDIYHCRNFAHFFECYKNVPSCIAYKKHIKNVLSKERLCWKVAALFVINWDTMVYEMKGFTRGYVFTNRMLMEIARWSTESELFHSRTRGFSINNMRRCLVFLEARKRFNHSEIFLCSYCKLHSRAEQTCGAPKHYLFLHEFPSMWKYD